MNYLLITKYGVVGAAYATVLTYFSLVVILLLVLAISLKISFRLKNVIKPAASSVAFFYAMSYLPKLGNNLPLAFLYLALAVVIYLCAMIILKGTTVKEISTIAKGLLKK